MTAFLKLTSVSAKSRNKCVFSINYFLLVYVDATYDDALEFICRQGVPYLGRLDIKEGTEIIESFEDDLIGLRMSLHPRSGAELRHQ
jgi:hypothetical protein